MSQPIFRQVPNRVFICISLKTPKTFTSTDAGIPCNVFNSDVFGVVLMYISHNILCLFFISVIRSERDKFVFMLLNIAEGKTPYTADETDTQQFVIVSPPVSYTHLDVYKRQADICRKVKNCGNNAAGERAQKQRKLTEKTFQITGVNHRRK